MRKSRFLYEPGKSVDRWPIAIRELQQSIHFFFRAVFRDGFNNWKFCIVFHRKNCWTFHAVYGSFWIIIVRCIYWSSLKDYRKQTDFWKKVCVRCNFLHLPLFRRVDVCSIHVAHSSPNPPDLNVLPRRKALKVLQLPRGGWAPLKEKFKFRAERKTGGHERAPERQEHHRSAAVWTWWSSAQQQLQSAASSQQYPLPLRRCWWPTKWVHLLHNYYLSLDRIVVEMKWPPRP